MNSATIYRLIFIFLLLPLFPFAQTVLDLETVITKARQHSPAALAAKTQYENSDWTYKSYRADMKPSVSLNATLPNFNRSIGTINQDDGSQRFVPQSLATSFGQVSINQNLGLTGGQVFMTTGLSRIDVLGDQASTSYLSTPINIGFRQNIFGFNEFKWLRKTEPLRYSEAQRRYFEDLEGVAVQAVNLYFNFYDSKMAIQLAQLNASNNDTLYKISQGRYQIGKIAEHELLQMELNVLNARKDLRQARIDLSNARAELSNFTGIALDEKAVITPPLVTDTFTVAAEEALQMAIKNRSSIVNMDRQLIEAEQSVAQARTGVGPNISLNAAYGVTGSDASFRDAYGNTLPSQQFSAGLSIPITNWGRNKAQMKIATSNKDLTELQVDNQRLRFEQEVINQVNQFNFRKREYVIAAKSDTIGQKQYEIAYKRYLIGKIDITDLNIALQGKDQSKRSYLRSMRNYWVDYYTLRQLTLYDFENDTALIDRP